MVATALSLLMATMSQGADLVTLEHANTLEFKKEILPDAQVLRGDVTFKHEGATMRCDSAHFYSKSNSFDAFGNVRMKQGDTLFVYGDVLHYDGGTKYARLRGNCKLINRDASLVTDSLDYNRTTQTGCLRSILHNDKNGGLQRRRARVVTRRSPCRPYHWLFDAKENSVFHLANGD